MDLFSPRYIYRSSSATEEMIDVGKLIILVPEQVKAEWDTRGD